MRLFKYLLLQIMILSVFYSYYAGASGNEVNQTENKLLLHAEPGERLRTIMQNINLTIHDSTNVDTQTEKINKQDMEAMIEVVEELLFYAEMMSTDLPQTKLDKNEIVTFRALAGQLYTEALNIQQTTRDYNLDTYDYDILNLNYRRLNETCAACHQLFRDN